MNAGETAIIAEFSPLPEGSDQFPVEFIENNGTIILRITADEVTVGTTDRTSEQTLELVQTFHGGKVRFVRINPMELSSWLGSMMGVSQDTKPANGSEVDDRLLLDRLANDAPIVNLVNAICIDGIRSSASDIHIETNDETARVRYRLDGSLKTVRTFEATRFPAVSSRIKIMANLNILERRQPQDGRITVSVGTERVDMRVSIVPVTGGESIVLRILGKSVAPTGLDSLGFNAAQLSNINRMIRFPHGLVLVTGPTGSGKTTTLNAMIHKLVSDSVKVVTIEDPVEFVVPGANQIQINEQIGLGFDVILRRVLRQDPNIIMVGEIRDKATAEIAVRAALTGHLVLSTLHTNNAVSAITRLVDMGVEPYLAASVLRGIIAQRLVRRLCPACRIARERSAFEKSILAASGMHSGSIYDAAGCPACDNSGFRGRVLIAESFITDPRLEELISQGARTSELAAYLDDIGMRSMIIEAAQRIADGQTTFREASKEISFEGDIA